MQWVKDDLHALNLFAVSRLRPANRGSLIIVGPNNFGPPASITSSLSFVHSIIDYLILQTPLIISLLSSPTFPASPSISHRLLCSGLQYRGQCLALHCGMRKLSLYGKSRQQACAPRESRIGATPPRLVWLQLKLYLD